VSSGMQTRILGRLHAIAAEAGLELVDQPNYANTGILYAQDSEFTTHWQVRYDFQSDHCGLHLQGRAVNDAQPVDRLPYTFRWQGGVLSFHVLRYDDGERIRAMFQLVSDLD
jgi:hypothetical protein